MSLRFYLEKEEEQRAYDKVDDYKRYGFETKRDFIIASILAYEREKKEKEQEEKLAEKISDLVVQKLAGNLTFIQGGDKKEKETEIYKNAMSFIDNL